MDQFDIRLIIVVLFLVFGSTLIKFVKKIRNKIFKPTGATHTITIETKNGEKIVLEDTIIPIPADIINAAVENHDSVQTIPPIESRDLEILEERFVSEQENQVFATVATNSFRAWRSGLMLKIIDPHDRFSKKQKKYFIPIINAPGYKDFVFQTFLGVQNADLMPKAIKALQEQYTLFFQEVSFDEHEFMVAWGLGLMLSNKRLFVFTQGKMPRIQKIIPLVEIKQVIQENTGVRKLN